MTPVTAASCASNAAGTVLPVFVSVNCNNYLIRRGETVMVPLFIKKELDRAELQRKRAEYYRDEGWKQSLIVQEGK